MTTSIERTEAVQKLAELIKGIRIAMLTTVAHDGVLRSRPMATQDTDFDGDLWFFTQAGSEKVDEVQEHHQVNLSYVAEDDNRYVSVSGTATLVRDQEKIKELWKPMLKAWFPKGPDDPDIALLQVSIEQAEYWDSPSSTMVHIAGFVKAIATGQRYEPGENEKFKF